MTLVFCNRNPDKWDLSPLFLKMFLKTTTDSILINRLQTLLTTRLKEEMDTWSIPHKSRCLIRATKARSTQRWILPIQGRLLTQSKTSIKTISSSWPCLTLHTQDLLIFWELIRRTSTLYRDGDLSISRDSHLMDRRVVKATKKRKGRTEHYLTITTCQIMWDRNKYHNLTTGKTSW